LTDAIAFHTQECPAPDFNIARKTLRDEGETAGCGYNARQDL